MNIPLKIPATIDADHARLPAAYESARTALANCAQLDECQSWADKAAALASYAKQARDDEMMKMAVRIRDRAIRRAGELLKQIEPGHGANQNITDGADSKVLTRTEAARQAGMSERQQVTAIRVANVPQEDFDRQVESDKPPTITELALQGMKRREPAHDPQQWLKGRDPQTFNACMHFVADVESFADEAKRANLDVIIPALTDTERQKLRTAFASIDKISDMVMTRI